MESMRKMLMSGGNADDVLYKHPFFEQQQEQQGLFNRPAEVPNWPADLPAPIIAPPPMGAVMPTLEQVAAVGGPAGQDTVEAAAGQQAAESVGEPQGNPNVLPPPATIKEAMQRANSAKYAGLTPQQGAAADAINMSFGGHVKQAPLSREEVQRMIEGALQPQQEQAQPTTKRGMM